MSKCFVFIVIGLCTIYQAFAQPGGQTHGTIKIAKPKEAEPGEIYIRAQMKFDNFELTRIKGNVVQDEMTAPSPVLPGYSSSPGTPGTFNYTAYFNDQFKRKTIDLEGKAADTVFIAVKVLANGKVYIKDKTNTVMINGVTGYFDPKLNAFRLDNIHLYCLQFLKEIHRWIPGCITQTEVGKFKKQQVIMPHRTNVTASGVLTIIFSATPLGEY